MSKSTQLNADLPSISQGKTAQTLYLLLAIAGSTIPWCLLANFFLHNGFSLSTFFQTLFANGAVAGLTADFLISSLVFFCFAAIELRRLGLSQRWLLLYLVLTLGIGLSCGLPLFFYLRERAIAQRTEPSN